MTVSNVGRFVDWEGCYNARDLGGLGALRPGALIRADSLDGLTARGWTTLSAQGVRTVIDLRNDGEAEVDHAPRPAGLTTLRIPLDGIEHRDFWDVWWGTPGFGTPAHFRPFLERFPDRVASVARAVAGAPPGGSSSTAVWAATVRGSSRSSCCGWPGRARGRSPTTTR